MASISYRIFNNEEKDEYPGFSICFMGSGGRIFDRSHDVFNSNNVTRGSYYWYLKGGRGRDINLYGKDYPAQFTTIEFEDVVWNISEGDLMNTEAYCNVDCQIDLIPTFRSPNEICVSKNMVHRKNVKQNFDYISMDSCMLYEQNLEVRVYVHKEGQFIRSRANIYGQELKNGVRRNINIGQVDILRKRANGKIPCDQYMKDEDEYRIEQVIKSVGCIPTFWRQHAGRMGLNQTYPICTNTMDYGKVQTQLQRIDANLTTLDVTDKLHCTMMMASVVIRDQRTVDPGMLKLFFVYHGASYREIMNTKAYTAETLLGQIGGFVGTQ